MCLPDNALSDFPTTPEAWERVLFDLFGPRLSYRERQTAAYRCVGAGDSDIAEALGVSKGSVKKYDTRVLEKFALSSVRSIAVFCYAQLWACYHSN